MAIIVDAPVYLARRHHPEAGAIIKVGRSTDAPKRCRDLGARLILQLPPGLEHTLHRAFADQRVWVRTSNGRFPEDAPQPLVQATSEWFYEDGIVLYFLQLCASTRPQRVPTMQDALAWLNQAIATATRPSASQQLAAHGPEECVPRPSLCKRDAVDGRTRRAARSNKIEKPHAELRGVALGHGGFVAHDGARA
jgi:hypothetical protein